MSSFVGTRAVRRLIVRRDRVRLSLWIFTIAVVALASAAVLPSTYPDQAAIDSYAALIGGNPALIAFAGPGYGFDDPTIGVILVNEVQLWVCVGFALMSIFLVSRHTRAEEDAERAELLRASVLGRHAALAAAVAVVTITNLIVAVLCAFGFIVLGYAAAGSVALAGSFLAVGLVFAGVSSVAAQVAGNSRSVLGLSAGALGLAFLVRAVGDVRHDGLRWLSPIGWAQGVRAFAGEDWWLLLPCVAAAAGLAAAAFGLSTVRDLGSGMMSQRPGVEAARPWMCNPVGLGFRQHRGALAGWMIGMFTAAVLYGSIGDDIEELVDDNPIYADLLTRLEGVDLTDAFFATSMVMLATIGAGYAIAAVLRLHSEETAGRLDPIVASPTSRMAALASHLLPAAAGSLLLMLAAGIGVGVSFASVSGDASEIGRMIGAALVTVPAVLVLIGLAVTIFGLWPRATIAAWGALAAVAVIGFLGEVLRLPAWVHRMSPFDALPAVPAERMRWLPVVVLLAVAAVLTAIGAWAFRRRDVAVA